MAASPAEIQAGRDQEWSETRNYWRNVNISAMTIRQTTIAGVPVRIRNEGGNTLGSAHKDGIETAVKDIVKSGRALPALDFYLCTSMSIPNVAMKTYDGNGQPTPIIFLGPKMWSKNPMAKGTDTAVVGGSNKSGVRGVADQAYDGTTRFFGNPKSKAQATTIVVHELGHILHEMNNPGVFWEELNAGRAMRPSPNGAGWMNASVEVSSYAGKGSWEFVAEVFAGQLMGKTYSGAVTNAYNALGGP